LTQRSVRSDNNPAGALPVAFATEVVRYRRDEHAGFPVQIPVRFPIIPDDVPVESFA